MESRTASFADLGRPALAVPTFSERGGGVAYVSRLLRAALTDNQHHSPRTYELSSSPDHRVSTANALRLGTRVLKDSALKRADWILFSHAGISETQRWIPGNFRLPFGVQLHGTECWEDPLPPTTSAATLRLAPSRFTAERALTAHPELAPIVVCPHGLLPTEEAEPAEFDAELIGRVRPCSAIIISRLAATERRKGHDQLLDCWPIVLQAIPTAQLIIVGEGSDRTRLEEKARQLGLEQAVLFAGYASAGTVEKLLRTVRLLAMPSQQEGFGIVYLEAMRAGLPCIGAINDGASEPILHNVTGFLIEQSNLRDLSTCVIALMTNNELQRQFGAAGRERYLAEFSFARYRDRLRDVLRRHFTPAQG